MSVLKPTLAILGRPNVGKSTLFNRLAGRKLALVDDQPGVTRDRRYADAELVDLAFRIIDTAGMEEAGEQALESRMLEQTRAAIAEADMLAFVIDSRVGVTPIDEFFAREIRATNKPVVLIANKAEGNVGQQYLGEIYALGFERVVLLSAEHNEGMADFYDALCDAGMEPLPDEEDDGEDKPLNLVIMGRPNAGKSTLINALLGEDRLLTGPEAGITRDTISIPFDYKGQRFQLFDTAGMRKRSNMDGKLEKLAVSDTIRALTFAEVVVLLMDATIALEKQDAVLGSLIEREGRAVIIGLNKWDLMTGDKKAYLDDFQHYLSKQLPQLNGVHIVTLSAKKGQGLEKVLDAALSARAVWNRKIGTSELNRWLEGVISHHTPPLIRGRRLKIKYLTQTKARPPTFQLFTNMDKEFPDAYLRYLVNGIRQTFKLEGTPIRMIIKASENPFAKKAKKR
jgi:GTP-binding protein